MQRREFWDVSLRLFPVNFTFFFTSKNGISPVKIVWNIYYSFSLYILGELTVNH